MGKAEQDGDKKRMAKRAPQTAPGAKPSRGAPVAQPAALKLLISADLSQSLFYRIRRAQLSVFKDMDRRLAAFAIGPSQFFVLLMIEANPGANQLAIAQSLSIERAGLGRLVDHLERRGLVQRSASAVHRRYYVLCLTAAGAAMLDRLRPAIAASEKTLAEMIGPRPFRELQLALERMLDF
jgi:DNA-binding MarR family transcriptional regulator